MNKTLHTLLAIVTLVVIDPSIGFGQRGNNGRGGSGGAQGRAPAAGGGSPSRAPTASGAQLHTLPGNAGAQVHAPPINAGGQVHTPPANTAAQSHTPPATGGAQLNAPPTAGGARVNVPGGNPAARANVPPVSGNAAIRGSTSSGAVATPRVNIGPSAAGNAAANPAAGAHTTLRVPTGNAAINLGPNAATNFRTNWHTATPTQLQAVRTNLGSAVNSRTGPAVNAGVVGAVNPARAAYWAGYGNATRNSFMSGYGGSPYFNTGFWPGRNLIGFGVASGLGGYGGLGGGYGGMGGGWWGYSPWIGNQPYGYWYGNPGWNTFANSYGWNSPYYYDYGSGGNVAYQGNQVLVNNQPVGTASDYAQSAADLAAITPEQMNAQHDWMPLGTFSVATSQEDKNPVRVAQLAYDNKEGLISGTIFNRQSNNLYTLQGRVDPQTQRVAFTVGKDPNTVMETGLYNLTQNETPVLVHFGPTKTATYVFARLPEPPQSEQPTTTAAPVPAGTLPADDLRR
jgi:hypothetical protein